MCCDVWVHLFGPIYRVVLRPYHVKVGWRPVATIRSVRFPLLGRRVRQLRQDKRWSLERLAAEAGLSKPTLIDLERGQRMPSLTTLLAVLNALGFTPLEQLAKGLDEVLAGLGHFGGWKQTP